MGIQIGLAMFTAFSTVLVILCTVLCVRTRTELRTELHALRKQQTTYELMVEEFEALKRRQTKLAGRFDRERKPPMVVDGGMFENELPASTTPPRDPNTRDFVNGGPDSDVADMLAWQRAQSPGG